MMNIRRPILYAATLSVLFVCACAHGTDEAALRAAPHPTSVAAEVSKDEVTIENLLHWPLEGSQGTERVTAGLQQLLEMESLQASQLYGKGPIPLSDKHVLSFVWIRKLSGSIDIGLEQEPCLPAERAAAMIDAVTSPVTHNDHGIAMGRTYDVAKNGVRIRLNTPAQDYRCVESIHISRTER